MVALGLAAPEEHGPEVAAWLARIELDELPSELLRVAAAVTGVVGEFDRGIVIGDHAIARRRARGRYGRLAPALVGRAWDGVYAGTWSATLAAAQDATVVARETDQPLWAVAGLAAPVALTGLRGDPERGLALADEADSTLPRGAADGSWLMIENPRGLAKLGGGDAGGALAHLRRVLDPAEPSYTGFLARWVVADAVEAAALANERVVARELLDRAAALPRVLARHHHGVHRLRPDAAGDRSRGRRARRGRAQRLCGPSRAAGAGAARPRRPPAPAAGAHPRRGRCCAPRATRSRRSTWAPARSGARSELRASGEAVRSAAVDPAAVLTPQELQIARMAADGLSNREIGQALYLSHRTIGSNLYRVFPKLGIASRGELRAALAR